MVDMVAKPASETLVAVSLGSSRSRCWWVLVPARLAKKVFSCTSVRLPLVWLTPSASSSRPLSSSIRALRSASGTWNGLTSYADTHSTSAYTGSSASSTRSGVSGRDTCAVATARSTRAAADPAVSEMPAAKPHTPSCTTRTDRPRVWSSLLDSRSRSRKLRCDTSARTTRTSAWLQRRSPARDSAASASARSGSAAKVSSILLTSGTLVVTTDRASIRTSGTIRAVRQGGRCPTRVTTMSNGSGRAARSAVLGSASLTPESLRP